ncbi:phospholipase D-like domain-containing protein [Halapricum hydrolyticum]|uniref:Uncharacterized protein n=1 Tax=Halapricum hydrolyticum TaxID=2979991 RepID=A0AAE3IDC0_9EURY|nr:hypothetical protein [Halapricum hydrolyticum]MCU4719085.1 hypothetical protein [Halapricum hydrolyticum]MCU4728142.1 hypothetical protein [Halapricum hydrolyticum]
MERQPNLRSLNWNTNAYENNREVALVLHGDESGAYFTELFERDWRGGITLVPVGAVIVVAVTVVPAGMLGRRIEFAGEGR